MVCSLEVLIVQVLIESLDNLFVFQAQSAGTPHDFKLLLER